MEKRFCPRCGAQMEPGDSQCRYCGEKFVIQQYGNQVPQTGYVQYGVPSRIDPSWPVKSKIAAGVLALLLGGIGVHKFYLGKIGLGILYLLFCWTFIPGIIAFIEGIIYLCSSDEEFCVKNHVRIG